MKNNDAHILNLSRGVKLGARMDGSHSIFEGLDVSSAIYFPPTPM